MKKAIKTILSFVIVACIAFMGVITTPVFNAKAEDTKIVFEFGTNGSGFSDGSDMGNTYTEENDDYKLYLTGCTKVYKNARDAKGQSCIKLGTSSVAGKFSFTAPSDVTSVIILAAKYKADASKLKVNNTTYTLSSSTNDGAYDTITVDTTDSKTVAVETTKRVMIGSITYVISSADLDEAGQALKEAIDSVETKMSLAYKYDETTKLVSECFQKVTTAPADWTGTYLIVYEAGNVAFDGGLATLDAARNTVDVAIENSTIVASDEMKAAAFAIAKNGDNYTIQSASGKYIGRTANDNGLNSGTDKLNNTLAFREAGVDIKSSDGAYLRYNATSGQERFRYFKSGTYTQQKEITLYKLVEGAEGVEGAEVTALENSTFLLRFGVEESLFEIEGAKEFGILVKSSDNISKEFAFTADDVVDGYAYVIVDLGDIIGDTAKLSAVFTVQAYIIDEEDTKYICDNTANCAEYSVATMIKKYYSDEGIADVEHLYTYLADKGLI